MFRVVLIQGVIDELFNEESFVVEEAFFFTIKSNSHYAVYNKKDEIIGIIPVDYSLFFKVDDFENLEDIDMPNVIRLFENGDNFQIVGTSANSKQVHLIPSEYIKEFRLVEDETMDIPFTNKAFDSEGIVVFKNILSLIESINSRDIEI